MTDGVKDVTIIVWYFSHIGKSREQNPKIILPSVIRGNQIQKILINFILGTSPSANHLRITQIVIKILNGYIRDT